MLKITAANAVRDPRRLCRCINQVAALRLGRNISLFLRGYPVVPFAAAHIALHVPIVASNHGYAACTVVRGQEKNEIPERGPFIK